ncbi:hypothetical protein [Spiroplasma ixodetis]|uniref:Spiroplasmavirus-related protein n=1 Tax=Spiroplasma ixodetis TaxID=2141 RepID=A0ABM8JQQ5_9MOLU
MSNERNPNCRRRKRDITNKFWHEKFCDLKPQIDKIQGKITAIKILDENTKGGNLRKNNCNKDFRWKYKRRKFKRRNYLCWNWKWFLYNLSRRTSS